MKGKNRRFGMVGFGVVAFASIAASATLAAGRAQIARPLAYGFSQDRDDHRRWDDEREKRYAFRVGYLRGYKNGKNSGYDEWRDAPEYRSGLTGYLGWMGERDDYRDTFKKGFIDGWRDGRTGHEQRYGRRAIEEVLGAPIARVYEKDWRLYSERDRDDDHDRDADRDHRGYDRDEVARLARERGFNDGQDAGREDREHGHRYEFDGHGSWKDATNGYRDEYGDREWYRRYYREGFQNGYEQGYRNRH
ncbi:MAG: hypothetical protein ACREDR_35280 [Blastocatellia bacterium]